MGVPPMSEDGSATKCFGTTMATSMAGTAMLLLVREFVLAHGRGAIDLRGKLDVPSLNRGPLEREHHIEYVKGKVPACSVRPALRKRTGHVENADAT